MVDVALMLFIYIWGKMLQNKCNVPFTNVMKNDEGQFLVFVWQDITAMTKQNKKNAMVYMCSHYLNSGIIFFSRR